MSECSDYPHKAMRKRLLAAAYGQPCPLCGWPMLRSQRLDLDHIVPRALGGTLADGARIVHARCNRSAGARLGNSMRRPAPAQAWRTSRRW